MVGFEVLVCAPEEQRLGKLTSQQMGEEMICECGCHCSRAGTTRRIVTLRSRHIHVACLHVERSISLEGQTQGFDEEVR